MPLGSVRLMGAGVAVMLSVKEVSSFLYIAIATTLGCYQEFSNKIIAGSILLYNSSVNIS